MWSGCPSTGLDKLTFYLFCFDKILMLVDFVNMYRISIGIYIVIWILMGIFSQDSNITQNKQTKKNFKVTNRIK